MKPPFYLLTFFFVLIISGLNAQRNKPVSGKSPSWVTMNQYDYSDLQLEQDAEGGYFELVYEQQISLSDETRYCRVVNKILNETGIQNASEVSVVFDPEYQKLTFHAIRILREGQTINQLNLSRIKTIQQETELNRFLYNGKLSAVLFLEDVRKGDIIEYSYSIKGFNPVFKGKYATLIGMNFSLPIGNLFYKLIVPKERELNFKKLNTSIDPEIDNTGNETIYRWKLSNVKSLRMEENTPSWYNPYAEVLISEYSDWKDVNAWALDLFPRVTKVSPGLAKKIEEIRTRHSTDESRVLAALRFVQDDVRYLGIEMGVNSHKPSHPDKIFNQRFGDCKDKSYLLCTMLQQLGVEASPVLINTDAGETIAQWLPAPNVFDHMTVRVTVDGKYYWFDATNSLQRGRLDEISYPDYKYGLVVKEETKELSSIAVREKGKVVISEVFDILNMSGDARFTVTTKYTGSFASNMRNSFGNSNRREMLNTFREYYANYYSQITADSLQLIDDEKSGLLILKEFYSLTEIWSEQDGRKKIEFSPYVIEGILSKPKDASRKMPFSILWPAKYREEIEINLPEEWNAEQSFSKVSNSVYQMSSRHSFDGRKTIRLEYEYETIKPYADPSEMKEYITGIDTKDQHFSYVVSFSDDGLAMESNKSSKNNNTNFFIGIAVLLVAGGVIWWTQKN